MSPQPRKPIVTSLCATALFLLLSVAVAMAGQAGTVSHVSGPLAAHRSDGSVKALSISSKVDEGDTLITEKRTYARIKFNDGSEVTLKPNTQFKVEKFAFDQNKPAEDAASLNLIKGGLRTITGQVGKRGNQDSYKMKTPTATIGIRGTIFTADYISPDEQAEGGAPVLVAMADTPVTNDAGPMLVAQASGLTAGLYVHVLDGAINLSNQGGSRSFSAGQFGFTPNFKTPPIVLPSNPGIQFTPPPSFTSSSGPSTGTHGNSRGAPVGGADCQVR